MINSKEKLENKNIYKNILILKNYLLHQSSIEVYPNSYILKGINEYLLNNLKIDLGEYSSSNKHHKVHSIYYIDDNTLICYITLLDYHKNIEKTEHKITLKVDTSTLKRVFYKLFKEAKNKKKKALLESMANDEVLKMIDNKELCIEKMDIK